jgi:hypothetical protein
MTPPDYKQLEKAVGPWYQNKFGQELGLRCRHCNFPLKIIYKWLVDTRRRHCMKYWLRRNCMTYFAKYK